MRTGIDARYTVGDDGAAATLLAEFRTWLGRERDLSPVSVRCYCQQAKAFLTGIGGPDAIGGLDTGRSSDSWWTTPGTATRGRRRRW